MRDLPEYEGQSLAYIRKVLALRAKWGSAIDAADDLSRQGLMRTDLPIEIGAVCFFRHPVQWGDIGLHLGAGDVLRLVRARPMLLSVGQDPDDFIGWVSGSAFRGSVAS